MAETVKNHFSLLAAFLKYLVAGGIGFVVDFSALTLCFNVLGLHYLVAAAMAFIASLVVVYMASNRWVFPERKLQDRKALEFTIFSAIGVIGLLLTLLSMWILVDVAGLYPLIAKIFTTAIVLAWNFGMRKLALY